MDKLIIIRPKEKGLYWVTVINKCFRSTLSQNSQSMTGDYSAFFGAMEDGKRNIKHYAFNTKKAVKSFLEKLPPISK